jgi:hypothetical protein
MRAVPVVSYARLLMSANTRNPARAPGLLADGQQEGRFQRGERRRRASVPQPSHETGFTKGFGGKSRSRREALRLTDTPRSQHFSAGQMWCPRQDSNLWPTA